MDPERGPVRRARIRDRATSLGRRSGSVVNDAYRTLLDRADALVDDLRTRLENGTLEDEQGVRRMVGMAMLSSGPRPRGMLGLVLGALGAGLVARTVGVGANDAA